MFEQSAQIAMKNKFTVIGGVAGLLLLTSIAVMTYVKGYPWTCGQAESEANKSQASAVQASKDYAANLPDENLNQRFKDNLARSEQAFAAKQRLCK